MRYFLFILMAIPLLASSQELKVLRLEYPTATLDMHTTEALLKSLADISKEDDATLAAYKGALLTIQAKFSKAIKTKKDYFKEGAALLEHAIAFEPDNIEIRCLRMGVQENSPKILKYKGSIDADKKLLIENYPNVKNEELKNLIEGYVRQSTLFNAAEKQLF